MATWVWILIAAAAVLIVAMVAWGMMKRRQTKQLQSQFGPEYDRTVETADSKRAANAELAARRDRREQLDIRPLSSAARERYIDQWQIVQAQFVDNPSGAVSSADQLIQSAMADRGYPVKDFETRAADVSVDHPGRRRELPAGASPRAEERGRRRLDRGSPSGDASLPGAVRRPRRAERATSRWRANARTRRRRPRRTRPGATAVRARDDTRKPVA